MELMAKFTIDDDIETLRNFLRRNGYLFLRQVFSRAQVQAVREQVIGTIIDQRWGRLDHGRIVPLGPVYRVGSPEFCKCVDALMRHEELHLLTYDPRLHGTLNAITGWNMFPHPRKSMRIAYPTVMNPEDQIPPHQDMYYVRGGCDTFTAWIPLGDYPVGHGGLRVLEGTHTSGLWPTAPVNDRFHCNAVLQEGDAALWRTADFEMGDALVFHSLLVHASGDNNTPEFRMSIDCRYSAPDQALNSDELLPPYFGPGVSPWSELTKGWKNPRLFDPPPGLVTEPPSLHPRMIVHRNRFASTAERTPASV
jgi:hypothetical protein